MKNTIKQGIAAGMLTLLIAAGGVAFADNGNGKSRGNNNSTRGVTKAIENAIERLEKFEVKDFNEDDFNSAGLPATLTINPGGQVRLTNATVTGVASTSITVRVWGFSFAVNGTSDTKVFFLKNLPGTFADIKVGDSVSVVGTTSETSPGSVTASIIHDRRAPTEDSEEVNRLRAQVEALIKRLNDLLAKFGGGTTTPPTPPADTTAPVLSGVVASTTSATSVNVAWTTNENSTSKVYYSTSSPVIATSSTPLVSNSSLVASHSLAVTGLTASTTYHFLIESKDASGNTGTATASATTQ